MKTEKYLYWTYFLPERYDHPSIIPGFFNFSDYKENFLFFHVKAGISFNFEQDHLLNQIAQYTFEISKEEEDYILSDMGDNGKRNYIEKIKELGLSDDYMLYAMAITPESVYLFKQLLLTLQSE